jgi:FkbM family methyltransferase
MVQKRRGVLSNLDVFLKNHFLVKMYKKLRVRNDLPRAGYFRDTISMEILLGGFYEEENLDIIRAKLIDTHQWKTHGWVVDAGANIGNHSLYFARYFRNVAAFEPHPLNFKLLEVNTASISNIEVFPYALGSAPGTGVIQELDGNMGASSLHRKDNELGRWGIDIQVLDSWIEVFFPVRLIKIDTEGHEFEVLRGARGVITRDWPLILFERSEGSDDFGDSNRAVNFLEELGYQFSWFPNIEASWELGRLRYYFKLLSLWVFGQRTRWFYGRPPNQNISLIVAIPPQSIESKK